MPAAALIVASLAALEPPRQPAPLPVKFIQTTWSLTASPIALAAAQEHGPVVGPGQARPPVGKPVPPAKPEVKREVTVLPGDKPGDEPDFDDLKDPAEAAAPAADAAATPDADATAAETPAAPADSPAADPLEDELAKQIKPSFDPLEPINRFSFSISQKIDKAVLRPVALTYYKVTPKPIRDGLRNVLSNWGGPIIAANDLLQLKPKRALKSLARFVINTLLGLGGLFDPAKEKKFNLPHHGNSFANTLAFYGVKEGPYFYIPVLGPTTLLAETNRAQGYVPGVDHPLFRSGRGSIFSYLLGLEDRATSDQELNALLEDSVDPYATFRETWLQDRKGEIERLKAPDGVDPNSYQPSLLNSTLDDPLTDPAAQTPAAPETPAPAAPAPETPAKAAATPAP